MSPVAKPKPTKTRYFLKLHGWSDRPPTHQDPVWHTVLESLVHEHCYYTIQSNTSLEEIEKSDYRGVLSEARITESFTWEYPHRQDATNAGLQIFGKVGELEQRGLKHLRFCESFGAESLRIEEPQDPLLFTAQDEEAPLVELHVTAEQADALRGALASKGLSLLPRLPYDDWAWGEISDDEMFPL